MDTVHSNNNDPKVVSITTLPDGHSKDTNEEAILRAQFGTRYAKAYSLIELNPMAIKIVQKALELFPHVKSDMIIVSDIVLGICDIYSFLLEQPPHGFETEMLMTEKEWALVLLQPKLYRKFRMFETENRNYARIRLPEVLIHVIANGNLNVPAITNMDELVTKCMTPSHHLYESRTKVMFFIAANLIHNFMRIKEHENESQTTTTASA